MDGVSCVQTDQGSAPGPLLSLSFLLGAEQYMSLSFGIKWRQVSCGGFVRIALYEAHLDSTSAPPLHFNAGVLKCKLIGTKILKAAIILLKIKKDT